MPTKKFVIIYFLSLSSVFAQNLDASGWCQGDKNVNCYNNLSYLNDYKRAVFTYNSTIRAKGTTNNGRSGNCTGTIVNRFVEGNQTGYYFMTANHCLTDGQYEDKTEFERLLNEDFIFTFNYQSPNCDDSSVPQNNRGVETVNGVRFVRNLRYQHTSRVTVIDRLAYGDFALLRIETPIPPHFNIYHAGWDADFLQYSTPYRVVHHPKADIKKMAVTPYLLDISNPICHTVTYIVDLILNTLFSWITKTDIKTETICTYSEMPYWNVPVWTSGVVEQGSSGSGLLSDNRKIIGVLTAGFGSCDFPLLEIPGFGKFTNAWTGSKLIRDALHPNRTFIAPKTQIAGNQISCYTGNPLVLNGNYFPANEYQPDNRIDIKATGEILFASGAARDHNRGNFTLFSGSDFNFECTTWETGTGVFDVNGVFDPQLGKSCTPTNAANARISEATGLEDNTGFDDEFVKEGTVSIEEVLALGCNPNPVTNISQISFYLPYETTLSIEIFDVTGKKVHTLVQNKLLTQGDSQVAIHANTLQSGVYICKLSTAEFSKSIKISVNL